MMMMKVIWKSKKITDKYLQATKNDSEGRMEPVGSGLTTPALGYMEQQQQQVASRI
jgi:hypothetical protein